MYFGRGGACSSGALPVRWKPSFSIKRDASEERHGAPGGELAADNTRQRARQQGGGGQPLRGTVTRRQGGGEPPGGQPPGRRAPELRGSGAARAAAANPRVAAA